MKFLTHYKADKWYAINSGKHSWNIPADTTYVPCRLLLQWSLRRTRAGWWKNRRKIGCMWKSSRVEFSRFAVEFVVFRCDFYSAFDVPIFGEALSDWGVIGFRCELCHWEVLVFVTLMLLNGISENLCNKMIFNRIVGNLYWMFQSNVKFSPGLVFALFRRE